MEIKLNNLKNTKNGPSIAQNQYFSIKIHAIDAEKHEASKHNVSNNKKLKNNTTKNKENNPNPTNKIDAANKMGAFKIIQFIFNTMNCVITN